MRSPIKHASVVRAALAAALVFVLAALAAGCAQGEAQAATAPEKRAATGGATADPGAKELAVPVAKAINVEVAELEPADIVEVVTANGVAQAVSDIIYSAELAGKITALSLKIGDRVRKGQLLARIDVGTLAAQATQVDAAYGLSKSTLERLSALEAEELVSKQQMDEVRSQLASAQSQRTLLRMQLSKSAVRSGRAGVVANVFAERLEFVGPGQPIIQVVDLRDMIVEAHLAETEIAGVAQGAAAEVELDALGETFAGAVEAIVPAADKDSKTFTVRVAVQNPDQKILVGMSARVRINVGKLEGVIAVPQSAVIEGKDGRSVFVAVDGKARQRAVTLGAVDGERVVIESGVAPGERLVVVGQRDVVDGQPVNVVR